MRASTKTALAASALLSAGAGAVAAGRCASGAALKPTRPAGFERAELTVRAGPTVRSSPPERTGAGTGTPPGAALALRPRRGRSPWAAGLPGRYGLAGRDCHAVVGEVLEQETGEAAPGTVVRRLERVVRGELAPGTGVRLTPQIHIGTPREALDIDFTEVRIAGELGDLPAWFVPGKRAVWIITAHGFGTTREHPMVLLPLLRRLGLPVLMPAHRGDPGAPATRSGLAQLGGTEWRDLEAAVRHAVHNGAERVVLHGWSSGATMALHTAARSAQRERISGLVLDSPVLDRAATLRALAAARGTPRVLLPLAGRAAQGRAGFGAERAGPRQTAARPGASDLRPGVPTLVVHGPDDVIAPWAASRALAADAPGLVSFHTVPEAPHAAMWNAGPERYEEALERFLTPLL